MHGKHKEDDMREKGKRKLLLLIFAVLIGSSFFSCIEPIKPVFEDRIKQKVSKSISAVQSVPYKYIDKIEFSWKKVQNASAYYVYELKSKTETLASKIDSPDSILGSNVTKHTINISGKERKRTQTRYVIVVARDSENKIVFKSEVIEGKTLGEAWVNEKAGHVESTFYSVRFQWASVEGASKYLIERKEIKGKESEGTEYEEIGLGKKRGGEESWEFVDEAVEAETGYRYKIRAFVMNGEELVSESEYEFKAKTAKQEAPSEVENLEVSKHEYKDRILLVWEEPAEVVGFKQGDLRYTIQRRERSVDDREKQFRAIENRMSALELKKPREAELNFEVFFEERSEATLVYQDKEIEVNREYEYRVVASYEVDKKRGKLGKPSDIVSGAVIPRVENIGIKQTEAGVRISWDKSVDFSGKAEVYRSVGGLEFEEVGESIEDEYEDTGVEFETEYYYKVRLVPIVNSGISFKRLHKGEFSDEEEYRHERERGQEFNFSVSLDRRSELEFFWDIEGTEEEEDFSIERLREGGVFETVTDLEFSLDTESKKGSAKLVDVDLSLKPSLYRLVRKSGEVRYYSKVAKGDILRAVEGVSATQGAHAEHITVSWQPSVGAKKYEVQLQKKGSDENSIKYLIEIGENDDEQMVAAIDPPNNDDPKSRGIEYDIRVVTLGKDENVDIVKSTLVQGKTFGPAGMNVEATKGSSIDKITVSWNSVDQADEYLVTRKTKGTEDEFEIARVKARESVKRYTYDDVLDNPNYLRESVPVLEKTYTQEYEYRVEPKRRRVESLASVAAVGYILGSPRIETSNFYPNKVVVSWKHVGGTVGYRIYDFDAKDDYYRYDTTITHTAAGERISEDTEVGTIIEYEDNSDTLRRQGYRYYKVISVNKNKIESSMPDNFVRGMLLSSVSGVRASDVNYENDKGIYLAKHGSVTAEYSSKSAIDNIDRSDDKLSYATKITWKGVYRADKYYIYRMDFNELTNFWRKIGEREADEERVFFDTNALVLREYRAMYWVVAVAQDKKSRLYFDASLEGNSEYRPSNVLIADAMKDFFSFNAGKQNENIEAMNEASNVDVGSRWITPREYLNWSIAVIGEAVYDIERKSSRGGYGVKHDGFSNIVTFTMKHYSLGAKVLQTSNEKQRRDKKSTELVIDGYWGGTFDEDCKTGTVNTRDGCEEPYYITFGREAKRLGVYLLRYNGIDVQSPYGEAQVRPSGKGTKISSGYIHTNNGLVYDFREGSISFNWKALGKQITVTKADNVGVRGPLNPHVTPIRLNRSYDVYLRMVYGMER